MRARVVTGFDSRQRCVRTRQICVRIIRAASQLGVRHLALEALFDRCLTERLNRDRQMPHIEDGYLAQPEMRELITVALDLAWTLVSYEADIAHY